MAHLGRLVAVGLVLSLTAGCETGQTSMDQASTVSHVADVVDLRIRRSAPATFVYQVSSVATIVTSESNDNVIRKTSEKTYRIVALDRQSFSVRLTEDVNTLPATIDFRQPCHYSGLTFDQTSGFSVFEQQIAVAVLSELNRIFGVTCRRWKIGETVSIKQRVREEMFAKLRLPRKPLGTVSGHVTLQRLTSDFGHPTALFTAMYRFDLRDHDDTASIDTIATWWVDVDSGVKRRSVSKGTIESLVDGRASKIRFEETEALKSNILKELKP